MINNPSELFGVLLPFPLVFLFGVPVSFLFAVLSSLHFCLVSRCGVWVFVCRHLVVCSFPLPSSQHFKWRNKNTLVMLRACCCRHTNCKRVITRVVALNCQIPRHCHRCCYNTTRSVCYRFYFRLQLLSYRRRFSPFTGIPLAFCVSPATFLRSFLSFVLSHTATSSQPSSSSYQVNSSREEASCYHHRDRVFHS